MDIIKKRIEWIDAMRGFTMILVVFNHIEHFGYGFRSGFGDLRLFFGLFRMPLFFFVSGFIAYRTSQVFSKEELIYSIKKKAKIQLLPTAFFGVLFSLTCYATMRGYDNPLRPLASMIIDSSKNGYWFTIVLLEMFIVYYFVSFLAQQRNKNKNLPIYLIIVSVVFTIISFPLTNDSIVNDGTIQKDFYTLSQAGINILSLNRLFYYFQWFAFGNIISRYRDSFFRIINDMKRSSIIIILFFVLFIVYKCINIEWVGDSLEIFLGYLGLIIVVAFFYKYENCVKSDSIIGKSLQYIGKRTLDVYLLHFFLLPSLPMVGFWFVAHPNLVLELTVGLILSLLVIGLCLLISNIIRISPLLGNALFGAKIQK